MNRNFYLIMMTIFAILFLVSYFLYDSVKRDLKECRTKEIAYKSLIEGNFDKFQSLMRDLPRHELDYYSSKFFDLEISLSEEEKANGNFGRALELVEKALKVHRTNDQLSKGLILKGEILVKMEKYTEALNTLEVFLNKDLPYRKEALFLLKNTAEKAGRSDLVSKVEEALRNLGR